MTKERDFALKTMMPGLSLQPAISSAIQDGLARLLPEVRIRAGIELDRLRNENNQARGHIEFLLLLDNGLVHVKGTLIEGETRTLNLAHQVFPLSSIRRVVATTAHEDKTGRAYMRSVELTLHLHEGTSFTAKAALPEGRVDELLAFVRATVEALK